MEIHLDFSGNMTSILLIVTIFFLLSLFKLHKAYKATNLPPGPWKLPIIGSMHHLATGSLPQHTLSKLSKIYGPLMHLKLGQISTVVVSSPEIAKLFLKTHELEFMDRHTTLATDVLSYNQSGIAFTPYNNYWRQMRKICVIELLSNKRVNSFFSIRHDEVSNLVSFIEKSVGLPIDLSSKVYALTSSVTCRAAFGEKFQGQSALKSLLKEATSLTGGFTLGDFFPSVGFLAELSGIKKKLRKFHDKVDVLLDDIIKKRRECNGTIGKQGEGKGEKEDLLDVLLKLHDENEHEFPIVDDSIKAVFLDMFVAGTDTSATVIEWAMTELIKNPRAMEKVQYELRLYNHHEIKNLEESDKDRLHYLKLVIKETMRLHPPVPIIPRKSAEPCVINGFMIPAKTNICVNVLAMGRDPDLWEDAEKFIPERFDSNMFEYYGNHFEYLPFGAGRRICPGISFAVATIELVLSQILYHFNWNLPNQITPEEVDMIEISGLMAGRRNPLCLVAEFKEAP